MGIVLSDFDPQLLVKMQTFLTFFFTLRDAADISPIVVLNQNATAKERRGCVFFKN